MPALILGALVKTDAFKVFIVFPRPTHVFAFSHLDNCSDWEWRLEIWRPNLPFLPWDLEYREMGTYIHLNSPRSYCLWCWGISLFSAITGLARIHLSFSLMANESGWIFKPRFAGPTKDFFRGLLDSSKLWLYAPFLLYMMFYTQSIVRIHLRLISMSSPV